MIENEITEEIRGYLAETAKWAKFLGIMGYVGIGLMVILSFFMGALLNSIPQQTEQMIPSSAISIIYFVFAAIYFFPIHYLFNFGKNMKISLQQEDQTTFTEAFKYLKSHYKFIGIFTAIILSLYALMIVFGIIGGLFAAVL